MPPPEFIRGAEVNALVDPHDNHIIRHIGKAAIGSDLIDGRAFVTENVNSFPKKCLSVRVIEPVRLLAPEVYSG